MRFTALFLFLTHLCVAQVNDLDFYGDAMLNAVQYDHKAYAADRFTELFEKKLSTPDSFKDEMKDIQWVSKMYSLDTSVRVITYQIQVAEDRFKSFGFLQESNGTLIKLNAVNAELEDDIEYLDLDPQNWYGALYYNIIESEIDGTTYYLLFGYDGYSKYDRRKLVDVLYKNEEEEWTFGSEIFEVQKEGERADVKKRILIEYSADSNVTLNFQSGLDMIVHDHLIRRIGSMPGQGATNLSDGSLVGYQLKESKWQYVERIFNDVLDEAPFPQPVLGTESGKDILGKGAKKKKKRN